jgi:PKD-like domain/CHU_C Type IX secretion signal domain/SprB repeat
MSCALALPVEFVGDIDCSGNIMVDGDDKQICSDQDVLVEVVASQSGATINLNTIDNPNVTGETLTGTFSNSIASFTDHLVNTGTNIEIVTYVFTAQGANSICEGPPFELEVTVYPNLDVQFAPTYVCDGLCTTISPNVTGGSGVYVSYQWSNGTSGPGITVCPTSNTTYLVTITDNQGCTGTGEVEVEVKPKVDGALDPDPLTICQDDVEDIGPYIVVNMTSGNDPYTYTWNFPGGIFGLQSTTNYNGDTYEIEEENSVPSATPRDYSVNIVDVFGCETTLEGQISIDGAPDVEFTYPPLACGQNTVVLKAMFDFGQSSSGLDKFELYDCEDNLIATKNNNPSFFTIADLSVNNCFVLKAITNNGCISSKTLTVAPPVGTQAVVNGTSPICAGQNSTLSVTNAAAFVNPTFAWSNGLTGPNITVGPIVTTTYVVTVTEPSTGCTDEANFEVVVNQQPIIGIVGSTTFCLGSSTTIQATSSIPGSSFVWSGAGTSNADTVLVTIGGPLTVTVTPPSGCAKDTTFNVTSSTSLTVNVNDLALCDNGVDTLTPGDFFTSYVWAKDGVTIAGATTPKLPVNSAGLYTVTVSDAGGCTGIGTKNVTNSPSPNANVVASPVDVCRVNSGVGPTSLDFTTLVTGSAGTWSEILHPGNSGFSTVSLANLSNVSFLGENRDTFRFQYVTNTAILPCVNDTVFVDVLVNNCPCPSINFDPAEVCNDNATPVNLNTYLKVPVFIRTGIWTVTGGPGTATIANDSLMNVNGITSGVYNLNWVTSASIGACPNSGTHIITVNDAPKAQLKGNRFICNANTSLGDSQIDLDTILVAGANPGTWVQTAGTTVTIGAGNIISGLGLTPEVLTFEYMTNNAIAPCQDTKVTLQLTVRDCNCPLATIEMDTLCNGNGTVNLNTLLTIDPPGTTGTWSSNVPGAVTGSTFNATGITSGSYKITFTLNNDPGGSCAKFFEQDIVIRRQPIAEKNVDGNPCNIASGSGVTTLNLFSLLKAGYTPGGTWTQASGPTTLTIPGNAIVDFAGLNPGDIYTFNYDLTALDPCVPVSTTVTATVKDCNCPNVDLLPPSDICDSELDYDLSLLQDPNIAPGVWTVTSPLTTSITVKGNKTFDVNDDGTGKPIAPGKYTLRYTLTPAPGGTCPKFSEVILTVVKQNTATLLPSQTVCNVDKGNNDTKIDFRTLLEQTSFFGGTWSKPANFPGPFTDFTNVDFKGLPIGSKYTFTYTIDNANPCQDQTYKIEIEVIDCACPPIKPLQPKDACGSEGTVDLTQYNDPANPGDWFSTEVTIVNNKADVSGLVSGNYKLTYKIKNPLPNCPDSVNLVLSVVKPKNIGTAAPKDLCSNEPESVKLADLITGEDTGGTWKEVSLKPSTASAFNAANGTFNTTNQAAGTYTFEYTFTNQTPCPDSKQTVLVNVISAPTAQAGNPATLDCQVAEASLGDPTDNQPNVKYEWTHDGGLVVPNADKATTKVNFGGKFTITVTNTITGCTTTDDVLITVDPNKPTAQIDSNNVSCFNAKDGSIAFVSITGGKAPLQFSNNGGTSFQATPAFNNLSGGSYKMIIKDATGCTFIQDVVLTEPAPFTINIGNDTTIALGASVSMDLIDQIAAGAKNIKWTMTDSSGIKVICDKPLDQCLEVTVSPTASTTVCALATDNNGCIAEDCRNINLIRARNVVFSNILRPGLGTDNETFYPKSNSIGWINKMSIYDRWGNLMFIRENFAANDPSMGWDGTFNKKDVVPGVYTWVIELEYDKKGSGDLEVFKGDVTVIR